MKLAGLVVVVAACAHTPDLPLRPDPSPPAGSTTWTWTGGADATQLLARTWPATADVRGVVVIMHGLKDYSSRYAAFATKLAAHGYTVYAFDLRGHGRSAGPRVAPDEWNDYVVDLDRFLAEVEKREPKQPVFLFGHSMGGAIAARAAELHQPKLAGLILSGPAIAIDAAPILIAITRMAGVLSPGAPALKLDNHDFSSDPANAAAMDKDELIEQGAGPAKTAAGLVDGMRRIWRDADALTMPVLALHGTADKLTAPSGSRALIETIPAQDKTLRIYAGYFHDLVHEPNDKGKQVEGDIVAWLDAHTGGPAVATPPVYADELAGDPRGWTQEFDAGVGLSRATSTAPAFDVAVNLARPRPIGWHGDLSLRLAGDFESLALRPLGIAARGGPFIIGASAGGSWIGFDTFAVSTAAWAEGATPLFHIGLAAEHDRRVSGTNRNAGPLLGSDQLWLGITLRAPSDAFYWPHAHAGVGPAVIAGFDWVEQARGWFAMLGFELYGVD